MKSADPWLCLCPSRWPGGLPGPRLLPAVSLSEQPALPGVPGPPGHHSAGPDRLTRSEVLLRPHQAPGRQRQHPHHSWRQPLQQQVGALLSPQVAEVAASLPVRAGGSAPGFSVGLVGLETTPREQLPALVHRRPFRLCGSSSRTGSWSLYGIWPPATQNLLRDTC